MNGRGYFNYDADNTPAATIDNISSSVIDNYSLKVRLGGYLKKSHPCTACTSGAHNSSAKKYSHLEPWVEIWDRGRPESEIDKIDARAHGATKVVNGQIQKIIVTQSREGMWTQLLLSRDNSASGSSILCGWRRV